MKRDELTNHKKDNSLVTDTHSERESIWCEKYGYFIDLDACAARSLVRRPCRRCYQSLLQQSLPFDS